MVSLSPCGAAVEVRLVAVRFWRLWILVRCLLECANEKKDNSWFLCRGVGEEELDGTMGRPCRERDRHTVTLSGGVFMSGGRDSVVWSSSSESRHHLVHLAIQFMFLLKS